MKGGVLTSTWVLLLVALLIAVVCGFFLLLPFLFPDAPVTIHRVDPL